MDSAVCSTKRNVQVLGHVIQLNVAVLSDNSICMTHIAICSGCAWMSGSLLAIIICAAIIDSTATYPHLCLWLHVPCTPPPAGNEFSLMWHHSHEEMKSRFVLWHLIRFPIDMQALNWSYSNTVCLWYPLMAVTWWNLQSDDFFTWDRLVPYFLQLACVFILHAWCHNWIKLWRYLAHSIKYIYILMWFVRTDCYCALFNKVDESKLNIFCHYLCRS
jgi:hypothetical protein